MGYSRAGFDVVGVDIERQPNYPFPFIRREVIDYLRDVEALKGAGFAAIHASPPCGKYTLMSKTWGRARKSVREHPDLLGPTRELLDAIGLPYVIENVRGAPIRAQLRLCGTHFGLNIQKHRYFEGNWAMPMAPFTCGDHRSLYKAFGGPGRNAENFRAAQAIDWLPIGGGASRNRGVTGDLYNAIPPDYTEWIGRALLEVVQDGTFTRQEATTL